MNDERFDADLRAVLNDLAPVEVPVDLRLSVLDVPRRAPGTRGWRLTSRSSVVALAGLAVTLVAALVVVLLRPMAPGPTAGGLPVPHSALVGTFVEQTDGLYGYRMLRPANWTPTGGDGMSRLYVTPGYQGPEGPGLVLSVVNLRLAGETVGQRGSVAQWLLFQKDPDLVGWTAAIERMWRADGVEGRLLQALPAARVYQLTAVGGRLAPGLQLYTYAVVAGQPLGIGLVGSGAYSDLGRLESDGILEDYETMSDSVVPIAANPANVTPPLPAAPAPSFIPPTETPLPWSSAAVSPPPSSPTGEASSQPAATSAACTTSQLRISVVDTGAAAGTVGGWLRFVNTATEPCSVRGWPMLVGVTASGATTQAADANMLLDSPNVEEIPTVTLSPGDAAFAAFAGGDNPAGPMATCAPSYTTLRVTPPGASGSVSVSAWNVGDNAYLPACSGLEVTMLVPASMVPYVPLTP